MNAPSPKPDARRRSVGSWSVELRFENETWYLIHDFEALYKMWHKALTQRRFFPLRYAGRRYYVNPLAVIYINGKP